MTTAHNFEGQNLLQSVNQTVGHAVQPAKCIEQLGNGAAFLHLLKRIHPELVPIERVISNPADVHEVTHNLRLLASAFQQTSLKCRIDTHKLAQMKYSENYHIAVFLMKSIKDKNEAISHKLPAIEEEFSQRPKKFKVTVLNQPKAKRIIKEEPPSITINDLCALQSMSRHRLQPIGSKQSREMPIKENKLTKIANILQIGSKSRSQFSQKYWNGKIATLESSFCVLTLNENSSNSVQRLKIGEEVQGSSCLNSFHQLNNESSSEMQEQNEENTSQYEKMECQTVCSGVKSRETCNNPNYDDIDYPFGFDQLKNPFARYIPRENLLLREM